MKLSIGDVIDRYTIAMLKNTRGGIDNHEEIWAYQEYISKYPDQQKIRDAYFELLDWNGKIWALESDIRLGKEGELGLEEVGRRALEIRNYNAERIKVKNEVNFYYQEGFEEIKINHASKLEK